MLRLAAAAILMAFSTPAHAADWYYVSNANDYANISFIDKDSIRVDAAGVSHATMFSLLAVPEDDGALAYAFQLEVKCATGDSRLVAATIYDSLRTSRGEEAITTDWAPTDPGTQGEAVTNFVCSKGKANAANPAAGKQLPFDTGKTMLANIAKGGAK